MAQIPDDLIVEMRMALDDLGEARQQVADLVARECDPHLGAAVMRLMIAAEQSTRKQMQPQNSLIWGWLFGGEKAAASAASR
ncbi:MAG: hypothetical protein NZ734_16025 [Paracoccus sp.]|nr:hypothetical protein [Paracoccus sp. (in: a-proteobacteria)]